MPLRFTKTEKWDKPWFMQLSPYAKLLFLYLADRCDLAGIWEVNTQMASIQTGLTSSNVDKAMNELMTEYAGERKVIQGQGHLWLVNFIRHQRNLPLNPKNRAHKGIIESLTEHSGDFGVDLRKCLETKELPSPFQAPSKPLSRGYSSSSSPSNKNTLTPREGGVGETKVPVSPNGDEIFHHWNSYVGLTSFKANQKITWHAHRVLSPEIREAVHLRLKDYSEADICRAIDNYATVLFGSRFFWTYVWGLHEFLTRHMERTRGSPLQLCRFLPDNFQESQYVGREQMEIETPEHKLERLTREGLL
jgi:hypothetical protein